MKWLRLYYEFASDPKIQSMDETLQRRYIMLLLLQGNGDLEKLNDEELASALRITKEELEKTREIFEKKKFINGSWCLRAFNDRQFQSDDSKERVRRYREKKGSLQKRYSNGDVTIQDTDKDNIIYIVDYLNKKTEKNFKNTTPKTIKLIKARFKEGFTKEDFIKVIDNQCAHWKDSDEWNKYLRPETLFGTKFESYLNNKPIQKKIIY